nr:hypothetical protein [Tanacetum cinerariifolium]
MEKEGHSDYDSKHSVHQADHPPSSEDAQVSPKTRLSGMPIPGRLITANIREASYYQEYQENVAKHRGFLAGETGSTQDLPTPKQAKLARKPQPQEQLTSPLNPKGLNVALLAKHASPEVLQSLWAVEESMNDAYALPKGPLPPVVIKEPESGKYQPLPEVPGKGKAKVSKEQVAHDLLSLQKYKKTSLADQYIFQRRVSEPTASPFHDESPYEVLGQSDSKEESEKIVLGVEKGCQDEDREHMDLDVANVSPQPSMEQLYKGFTATVYPNGQENLKLTVEEPVLLEEPASSSGTLSSLQHLSRDFSFGDQFFSDKHSDADKSTETEVESMMNVTIQQALSSISLMTSPIIDLTSRPESPKEHQQLNTTTTTTTTLPPPQAPQQSTT